MGRTKGISQGSKLSEYATKTERQARQKKKRNRNPNMWGQFSLHSEGAPVRYNR